MPCGNGNYKLPRAVLAALSLTVCTVLCSPFPLTAPGDGLVCCLPRQGQQLDKELCHCCIPPSPRQMWNERAAAGTRGFKGQLKDQCLSKASSSSRGLQERVNPDVGTTRQQPHLGFFTPQSYILDEAPAFMRTSPRLVFVARTKQLEFYLRQ